MSTRIDKIRSHFRENKKVYFALTGGVVVGASAVILGTRTQMGGVNVAQAIFSPRSTFNQSVITLIERSTPSKPVHLVGTNLYFDSLNEAARQTGHSLSRISRNVKGDTKDVNGDVFQLLESAA